jgi:hypothetical protein
VPTLVPEAGLIPVRVAVSTPGRVVEPIPGRVVAHTPAQAVGHIQVPAVVHIPALVVEPTLVQADLATLALVVRHTTNGIARPRIAGEALVVKRGSVATVQGSSDGYRGAVRRLELPLKVFLWDRRQLLPIGGLVPCDTEEGELRRQLEHARAAPSRETRPPGRERTP